MSTMTYHNIESLVKCLNDQLHIFLYWINYMKLVVLNVHEHEKMFSKSNDLYNKKKLVYDIFKGVIYEY